MLPDESAKKIIYTIMDMYPDAIPKMRYDNPFKLLMVVILSAQATDKSVAKVRDALFERYPNPQMVVQSSPEEIETYIKSIGLYRNKAKYIYKSSQQILDHFNGKVPHTKKELLTLTGIGPKSANILLNVAFNEPAFAVDTHVARICRHHKIVDKEASVKEIEARVTELIPSELWGRAHQSMISFGKEICTSRNPTCHEYLELNDE